MLTFEILQHIAPLGNHNIMEDLVDPLNEYLAKYQINNLYRVTNFLGQACEESDQFKTLQEYASGRAYEGRHDLGNIYSGDGVKFKGRGIFMITGRANYDTYGKKLSIDLINHPELAATAPVAVQIACLYWNDHNLTQYADKNDMISITKKINGGYNGLAMRQQYTKAAMNVIHPIWTTPELFFAMTLPTSAPQVASEASHSVG